jgi:hypothetical protein
MDEAAPRMDLSQWFPTYGFLTSQRILERLQINLSGDELVSALKNHHSLYYQLLIVPLKNILNGIIFQQAQDYQVYAQKLFIDYLLSGEDQKDDNSPGANTRADLETIRLELVSFGESFRAQELVHQTLIAKVQEAQTNVAKSLQTKLKLSAKKIAEVFNDESKIQNDDDMQRAIRTTFIFYDKLTKDLLAATSDLWPKMEAILTIKISPEQRKIIAGILEQVGDPRDEIHTMLLSYLDETDAVSIEFRNFRTQFYNLILRVTELIQLLPDYHVDKIKDEENRSSLYFDAHIGGE